MQEWPEPTQKIPREIVTLMIGVSLVLLVGSVLALFGDERSTKSIAAVMVVSLAAYAAAIFGWKIWTRS